MSAERIPSNVCRSEIEQFFPFPSRMSFTEANGGVKAYDVALQKYARMTDAIFRCIEKNTTCGHRQGIMESVYASYSNVLMVFDRWEKMAAEGGTSFTVEDVTLTKETCKKAFWMAIFACDRGIVDSIYRYIKDYNEDVEVFAALAKAVKTEEIADEFKAENLKGFEHVNGDKRRVLVFLVEADVWGEDLQKLFPKKTKTLSAR